MKILIFAVLILNSFINCYSHLDPFWEKVEIKSELKIEKKKILFKDLLSLPLNAKGKTKEEIIEITTEYYNKNYFIIHKNNKCNLEIKNVSNNWVHTITSWFFLCKKDILSYEELYVNNSLFIDYPYTEWNIFLKIIDKELEKEIIFTDTKNEFIWVYSEFKKLINNPKSENSLENNIDNQEDNNTFIIIKKFIKSWIVHILYWIDHILFLLVLILITFKLKEILFLVTGFTISHSITIILSWLWLISLDSKIVEPIIALSIIYMAISNLIYFSSKEKKNKSKINKRIIITFIFWLFHWLGFVWALNENAIIPENYITTSLISFNIWVELWQILIIILIFPILLLLKKHYNLFWKKMLQLISLSITLISVYWFFERVI